MASAINFLIGGNSTKFEAAMRTVEKVAAKTGQSSAASLRMAEREILKAASARDLTVRQSNIYAQALQNVQTELARVTAAEEAAGRAATRTAERRAQAAMRMTAAQRDAIAIASARLTTGSATQDGTTNPFDGQTPRGAKPPGGIIAGIGGIARGMIAPLTGIYAAMKTKQFIGDAIQADVAMQRIEGTLKAVSGSAEAAASDMAFLRSESDRVGFSFVESANAFARFSVAAKASNLTSDKTREIFTAVQESSIVMGMSADQTASAMLALEQMLSKGTISAQELKTQLGNAMPGAMDIFAKALGVTQAELGKMVESGKLLAADVLPKFADQLKKTFTLTDDVNKTIRDINRMSNAVTEFKAGLGELARPGVSMLAESGTGLLALLTGKANLWKHLYALEEAPEQGRGRALDKQLSLLKEQAAVAKKIADGAVYRPMTFGDTRTPEEQATDAAEKENKAITLDRESDAIEARNKLGKGELTREEKIAELTKKRAENLKNMNRLIEYQEKHGQNNRWDIAEYRNRNAKIDAEIIGLQTHETTKTSGGGFGRQINSQQAMGARIGGPNTGLLDVGQKQLSATKRTHDILLEIKKQLARQPAPRGVMFG